MASRMKWRCLDCRVDTGKAHEHYFVSTSIWLTVVGSNKGMLCVGCLEGRLGRKLVKADFTSAHINNPRLYPMSDRLRNRLEAS